MTPEQITKLADRIDGQALQVVRDNIYPAEDQDPDLESGPARHAAALFQVSTGLRAMVARA